MRTRLFAMLLVILALPVVAQPGRGQRFNQGGGISDLPIESLSEAEENSLYHMREEEKLARDVYLTLFEEWNLQVFENIAASEQQHTNMIKLLLDKYELSDPFIDERGVFTNKELQELYETLVTLGRKSKLDALMVGATIEDLDIYDLKELLQKVDNQDIQRVYENLMKGSRNHMRSFYSQLTNMGGEYRAQYITEEELQEIVNSANERGPADSDMRRGRGGRTGRMSAKDGKSIRIGNYPNPANPTTNISYFLEEPGAVELTIFNNLGQTVRSYQAAWQGVGEQRYTWDGLDAYGHAATSGIYYCRIVSGEAMAVHRIALMK